MERKTVSVSNGTVSYLSRPGNIQVVFLHGLGGSGNNWIKLSQHLPEELGLFMPDLAGHGRTRIDGYDFSVSMQVMMIQEFISACGIREPVLVGNSYGGWVSLAYALRSGQAGRLVLEDSAGINTTVGEGPSEAAARFVDRVMAMNPSNNRTTIEGIVKHNASGREKLTVEMLRNIRWNTLIVWGKEDRIIDSRYAKILHENIPGSSLRLIDGAGHTPHVTHPGLVAGILTDFLLPA